MGLLSDLIKGLNREFDLDKIDNIWDSMKLLQPEKVYQRIKELYYNMKDVNFIKLYERVKDIQSMFSNFQNPLLDQDDIFDADYWVESIKAEYDLLEYDDKFDDYNEPKRSWYPDIDWDDYEYTVDLKPFSFPSIWGWLNKNKRKYPGVRGLRDKDKKKWTKTEKLDYEIAFNDYKKEKEQAKYEYDLFSKDKEKRKISYKQTIIIRKQLSLFTEKQGFPIAFAKDLNFTMFIGLRVPTGYTVHKVKTIELWKDDKSARWRKVMINWRGAEITNTAISIMSAVPLLGNAVLPTLIGIREKSLMEYDIFENLAYVSSLNDYVIKANWDKIKKKLKKEYE